MSNQQNDLLERVFEKLESIEKRLTTIENKPQAGRPKGVKETKKRKIDPAVNEQKKLKLREAFLKKKSTGSPGIEVVSPGIEVVSPGIEVVSPVIEVVSPASVVGGSASPVLSGSASPILGGSASRVVVAPLAPAPVVDQCIACLRSMLDRGFITATQLIPDRRQGFANLKTPLYMIRQLRQPRGVTKDEWAPIRAVKSRWSPDDSDVSKLDIFIIQLQ
jgi:hypothetical protein